MYKQTKRLHPSSRHYHHRHHHHHPYSSLHPPRCGDEIMEINDTVVYSMALNDVYSVLSQCPPGPVQIIISRHPDPKVQYFVCEFCSRDFVRIYERIEESKAIDFRSRDVLAQPLWAIY